MDAFSPLDRMLRRAARLPSAGELCNPHNAPGR